MTRPTTVDARPRSDDSRTIMRRELGRGHAEDAEEGQLASALEDQGGQRVDDAEDGDDDGHGQERVRDQEGLVEDPHHFASDLARW